MLLLPFNPSLLEHAELIVDNAHTHNNNSNKKNVQDFFSDDDKQNITLPALCFFHKSDLRKLRKTNNNAAAAKKSARVKRSESFPIEDHTGRWDSMSVLSKSVNSMMVPPPQLRHSPRRTNSDDSLFGATSKPWNSICEKTAITTATTRPITLASMYHQHHHQIHNHHERKTPRRASSNDDIYFMLQVPSMFNTDIDLMPTKPRRQSSFKKEQQGEQNEQNNIFDTTKPTTTTTTTTTINNSRASLRTILTEALDCMVEDDVDITTAFQQQQQQSLIKKTEVNPCA